MRLVLMNVGCLCGNWLHGQSCGMASHWHHFIFVTAGDGVVCVLHTLGVLPARVPQKVGGISITCGSGWMFSIHWMVVAGSFLAARATHDCGALEMTHHTTKVASKHMLVELAGPAACTADAGGGRCRQGWMEPSLHKQNAQRLCMFASPLGSFKSLLGRSRASCWQHSNQPIGWWLPHH